MTSATMASAFCHVVTSSSKVARKRDAIMPCTVSWSCSSRSKSSSLMASTFTVAPSLYGLCTNSMPDQVSSSWRRLASIFSSFSAWSVISSTSALNLWSSSASSSPSFISGFCSGGVNSTPVAFISIVQWRRRMDLWLRAMMSGHDSRKSLMKRSRPRYASD